MLTVLQKSRGYLARGWTRHRSAVDAAGNACPTESARACQWCLTGAMKRAAYDLGLGLADPMVLREARDALHDQMPKLSALTFWNDEPHRTQRDVLDLLDRAIDAHTS